MPRYSKLILDLDGTLYCGPEPIPGAVDAVAGFRKTCSILFLSNNGNQTSDRLVRRLSDMGFEVRDGELVCSLDLIVAAVDELGSGLRILTMSTGDLDGTLVGDRASCSGGRLPASTELPGSGPLGDPPGDETRRGESADATRQTAGLACRAGGTGGDRRAQNGVCGHRH